MSIALTAFILATVFISSLLGGILGMAGGMVLMGALAWALTVQQAMMLQSAAIFFSNASRAFVHRKHARWDCLRFYFAGLALMVGLLSAVSFLPDKQLVFFLLGAMPFAGFAVTKHIKLDFTRPLQAFACGFVVTFFHMTSGSAGPVLDVFFQNVPLTRHQTIGTKAFAQAASPIVKFIYFGFIVSDIGTATAGLPPWIFLAVIPVAILGTHAAQPLLNRLTDKQFYKMTQCVLFVLGAVYLYKAFSL